MRILHISDLHVTEPHNSLESVWLKVQGPICNQKFDFVIVSGDLSQRADSAEYEKLLELTNSRILPLLNTSEKERVIFVPGNHDVDWKQAIGSPVSIASLGTDVKKTLSQIRRQPDGNEYREFISEYGHYELHRLDLTSYPKRFENVQRFLTKFYEGPKSTHRPFSLLEPEELGSDWSAHVFPDDKIAFFGFNSCHRNDRYYQGASFNSRAINNAQKYADAVCSEDTLRIAVWHHGLQSDSRRSDYLLLSDLAQLSAAGFRVGFHGHTHQNELRRLDEFFRGRFAISAVGSIGAGASERPEAVGNQFGIVRLYHNQLHVDLYEQATSGEYRNEGTTRSVFFLPEVSEVEECPCAKAHERTYDVDANGIAEVTVKLSDLQSNGVATVLAVVTPPSSRVIGDAKAKSNRANFQVIEDKLPSSRSTRFTVNNVGGKITSLEWKYSLSNGFALTGNDLDWRLLDTNWLPNLADDFDARPHYVRIRSDELVLRTVLPPSVELTDAQPLVERLESRGDDQQWTRVPSEESRCTVSTEANTVELRVVSPILHYRYASMYRIIRKDDGLGPTGRGLCDWLLEACRSSMPAPAPSLASALQKAIEQSLVGLLGGDVDRLTWIGLIGRPKHSDQPRSGRLLPAFGRFPNWQWATELSWGAGVAGHALRFHTVASWAKESKQKINIIYIPPPAAVRRNHEWIVCIPILIDRNGPALGIVSFEGVSRADGPTTKGRAAATFKNFALDPTSEEFVFQISTAVNQAFWYTLSSHPEVDECYREFAEGTILRLELKMPSDPPPEEAQERDQLATVDAHRNS